MEEGKHSLRYHASKKVSITYGDHEGSSRYVFVMRTFALLLALLAIPLTASARDPAYYRSVDGSLVHRPTRDNQDYGKITARCGDETRSYSDHSRGTCSRHGGVTRWGN